MKLVSFQVWNFRSINDSGPIKASQITALLGRNESGKTNLLLALCSLNPPEGVQPLSKIKDFPRQRRLEECTDETEVVATVWKLERAEKDKLVEMFPRAIDVEEVKVGRRYGPTRWLEIEGLKPLELPEKDIAASVRKIKPAVLAAASKLEDAPKQTLEQACDNFERQITGEKNAQQWGVVAVKALADLRQALANAETNISDEANELFVKLEKLAEEIDGDKEAHKKARMWVVRSLPIFVYLDEYPALEGHQNIAEYLARKAQGDDHLNNADRDFEKLCKVAGLFPEELQRLQEQQEQETRNQLANRAGSVVTGEIRRLWKDRKLTIRFSLDADHINTFVSDPNATYPVEVNFNERSRGFKWFFSFYMTFAADTKGGSAENAVLLLDEPGLFLHARSQSDLLRHFEEDFANQIIYTTHSPFMVPTHNLDAVRTVTIREDEGTKVTNDPTGDARTLFPLQSALGYDLAQSLFVGPNNLVVEGVTDYWIISSASDYLRDKGKTALHPDLTLTPAGGAQKVSYMVALLTSEELNVLVLLDEEKHAKDTKDRLVKSKLIREENVVFVTEAFSGSSVTEADVEDLLDPDVYEALVRESYKSELKGKKLNLNPQIPRLAKRFEAAFKDIGLDFYKTRPARLLLNRMSSKPEEIMTTATVKRLEQLFSIVNSRLEKHVARAAKPFQ
ncbi:MAG: AAA family ATPase [Gemmatimonadetes bacterium]|nr:AAA family ATPase [Gemmatimonadota bacterium]